MKGIQVILPLALLAFGGFAQGVEPEAVFMYHGRTDVGPKNGPLKRIPVNQEEYASLCDVPNTRAFCIHMAQGKVSDIVVDPLVNGWPAADASLGKIYARGNDLDFGILLDPNQASVFQIYLKGNNLLLRMDPDDKQGKTRVYEVFKHGIRETEYDLFVRDEDDKLIATNDQVGMTKDQWVYLHLTANKKV